MDRKTIFLGTIASRLFVALIFLYYGFVLDDAFITFRYAKHLAQGAGIKIIFIGKL